MFDIGFWELAVIGVIALLVVGPERLPAVARNVGRWVGRMRRYVNHVKQDIEREIHADEVRQLLEKPDGLESIRDVARETAAVFDDTRKELNRVANDAVATEGQASAPRVAHHAVDDDPFAPSSIAHASPNVASGDPADQAPAPLTPAAAQSDTATPSDSPSDSPSDEQRTERPGQR